MKSFKLSAPLKFDKVDFYKFQLRTYLPRVKLNDTEQAVVVYYYLHENPIQELLKDGVFKSHKSVENYVSRLRKQGLLVGKGKVKTRVNPQIKFYDEDFEITITVRNVTK